MEDFRTDIAHIREQVNQLYIALCGDDITKDGGLVRRVNEAEKKLSAMEKKSIGTQIYVKLLWLAAGGVTMAILSLILKK